MEAGDCCYRSFASVASNVFTLLRMFSSPASPGHRRADRTGTMVAYAGVCPSNPSLRGEGDAGRYDAAGLKKTGSVFAGIRGVFF